MAPKKPMKDLKKVGKNAASKIKGGMKKLAPKK
jgi:hypothetical protein